MKPTLQVTIDCADPDLLVPFWALALGYVAESPPAGFDDWFSYWRSIGVPEDELGSGSGCDSVVDPDGVGPRVWFQIVPERKAAKNRVHLDLTVSGGRAVPLAERRARIRAEADRLVAAGATIVAELGTDGLDYFGITLLDPEQNEFCLN